MSHKPQPGAYNWNEYVRQIKDAMRLLRHDIDEIRAANEDNADVLNFLLTMSGRLDDIHEAASGIWEIGQEHKHSRLKNDE